MKKYLISGAMALALGCTFVSCSDNDEWMSYGEAKMQAFDEAFTKIYGQIDPRQDWGFGTYTGVEEGVTRGAYPNANMWADEWVVPPQLTSEQKEIVRQYFQQNTPIGYQDPGWTNYFVQQVYKGKTKAKNSGDNNSLTTEEYRSANNGWVVGSNHMDHLEAVFADNTPTNKHRDHIFNYNNGTCSTNGNVQNSPGVTYYSPKSDTQHSDEIQLMVNSTTHAFGYFNSDGSLGHTDFTGLVHWTTIRDWANDNGLNGDCLDDGWNRSYMGFDFEQVIGDDVYAKNGNNIVYAKYSEAPESPQYIWDGQNVIPVRSEEILTSNFNGLWGGQEESISNDNGILVYNSKAWGGLSTWFGTGDQSRDLSSYYSIIVEFEQATPVGMQFQIQRDGDDAVTSWINQGSWSAEYVFDANTDFTKVTQIALQTSEAATVRIRRIYLKADNTMMYSNKPVPYLSSDQNTYCGDFQQYGSDDDVKIRKQYNGSEVVCLNWKKLVDERLSQGYLPVAGSNMKNWVKVQGGHDGYYSDWIVTLTQAQAVGSTKQQGNVLLINEHDGGYTGKVEYWRRGSVQSGRIFVEDLAQSNRGDIDFNDAVFDAYIYDVNVSKVMKKNDGTEIGTENLGADKYTKIDMLACGGTLQLTVAGTEVHSLFGVTPTTMVNTIGSNSVLKQGYSDHNVKTIERAPYYSSLSAIPVVVKVDNKDVLVLNNYEDLGKVPHMICVPIGTPWPQERIAVGPEVGSSNTSDCAFPLFAQYVGNASVDPWDNINEGKVYEWNHIPASVPSEIEEMYERKDTTYSGTITSEETKIVEQVIPTPVGTLVGSSEKYPHQMKNGNWKTSLVLTAQDFQAAGVAAGKKLRIYGVGYNGDDISWELYINNYLTPSWINASNTPT